jgi:hypothetical protein
VAEPQNFNHRGHRGTQGRTRPLFFLAITGDHSLDSVPQLGEVEIDEKPNAHTAQPPIGQQLSLMYRMDCFNAFHFDDNECLDDQVDAISEFDPLAVVNHRKPDLAGDDETSFSKLMRQASLVGALSNPGPRTA